MLAGHYSVAMAIKAVRPSIPLWLMFVAAQMLDIIWALLILAGVEKTRLVPGFTASNSFDFYHIPYSHGLMAAVIWSIGFGLLYLARHKSALVNASILAGVVASHWLLDLLVHVHDLPILYDEPKVGLGLWNYLWISQIVEVGVFLAGLALYVRATKPTNQMGLIIPSVLVGGLLVSQIFPFTSLFPQNSALLAILALIIYVNFASLAWYMEQGREVKSHAHG